MLPGRVGGVGSVVEVVEDRRGVGLATGTSSKIVSETVRSSLPVTPPGSDAAWFHRKD